MADFPGEKVLCDRCRMRPAVFHSKIIVNGKVKETHLCEVCKTEEGGLFSDAFGLGAFLSSTGFLDSAPLSEQIPACPKCGYSFGEYRRTGFLGCPACYDAFASYLEPSIRKFQKDNRHVGKTPKIFQSQDEKRYSELLKEREEAVKNEDFVRAAEINEEMKKLAGGKNNG